jgi:hypothetical protein
MRQTLAGAIMVDKKDSPPESLPGGREEGVHETFVANGYARSNRKGAAVISR